jgi:mitochondrial fission protein ELM1
MALVRYFVVSKSDSGPEKHFDLVIGAGSPTHIPVLNRKRETGSKAIVCMSPPGFLQSHFDLCLIPMHDRRPPAQNCFTTVGPPNIATPAAGQDYQKGIILVGGVDRSSHHWDTEAMIHSINELISQSSQASWTISSSPRTPAETEAGLTSLASESGQVSFFPFLETRPGWVDQQYQKHKIAWITGDSMSMIYEALSAGCLVGVLPVRWKKNNNKFAYSQAGLIEQGRVVTLAGWLDKREQWQEQEPLDEADRCAREILRRWWPTSLQ